MQVRARKRERAPPASEDWSSKRSPYVIPAKAGIQTKRGSLRLDSRLRGNDDYGIGGTTTYGPAPVSTASELALVPFMIQACTVPSGCLHRMSAFPSPSRSRVCVISYWLPLPVKEAMSV